MEHLARSPTYELWLEILERPFLFRSPFLGDDFVVMLIANDTSITPDEQFALSLQIVEQGCRYAVCYGYECSTWDDSIGMAFLSTDPNYNPSDDRFVMTTWHKNEPLEDVVSWFRWLTSFADFTPKYFLVLLVGYSPAIESEIRQTLIGYF